MKDKLTPRPSTHRLYGLLLIAIWSVVVAACSVTKHIPEGELLYVGIGKTKIAGDKSSKEAQRALTDMEKVLNEPPNDAFFGSARSPFRIPVGLWFYNGFVNDSTWVGRRLFKLFAEDPKLISAVRPSVRAEQARNTLREHGYFRATVSDSIAVRERDSLQARVYYSVDMDAPYRYDSISYMEPWLIDEGVILDHASLSQLKRGDQFNLQNIITDRTNLVHELRNRGYYYYSPDLLVYQIDTMLTPGAVTMRVREQTGYPAHTFQPWTIGKATVLVTNGDLSMAQDSTRIDDLTIRYQDKLQVRPSVFQKRVQLKVGQRYSQDLEQQTRQALLDLGAFSYVDVKFLASDTLKNILDLIIITELDRPWDASFEGLFKTKSNNFIGPGVTFSLGRRNVFGGGERLSLDLFGSYEWQINKKRSDQHANVSDINSYEVGANLNLQAPRVLLPWLYDIKLVNDVQTTYTLSGSILNRAGYFQITSLGLTTEFGIRRTQHKHLIVPLSIHYNNLSRRSETFDRIIAANPVLGLSLRSQLIPQMKYRYTFDNIFTANGSHHLHFEGTVAQAGNILNGLYALSGQRYTDTKSLFGVPFAQFVKATAELRYTYGIDRIQSLALRIGGGAIYSFGNMRVVPYSEQFYVGGANSLRAFTVRSIGPGRFIPREDQYAFMDQTGDVKLEMNAEYRLRLVGNLHGAIFLDAGNVWLLHPDENRPGGSLQEIRSMKDFFRQIALGSGAGLRYDLGFLVVRFDVGVGLHLPFDTVRQGYYNLPKFWDSIGYHLAVGYPF